MFSVAGTTRAGDAGTDLHYTVNLSQVAWNYPVTNRLLIEAGAAENYSYSESYVSNGTQNDIAVTELSTGVMYRIVHLATERCLGVYGARSTQLQHCLQLTFRDVVRDRFPCGESGPQHIVR